MEYLKKAGRWMKANPKKAAMIAVGIGLFILGARIF